MAIEEKIGDALAITHGILVHGCNSLGQMGSGIAKQIRAKWPECYEFYRQECARDNRLGRVIYWETDEGIIIANALTQNRIATPGDSFVVDYPSIRQAFKSVYDLSVAFYLPIHFPLIGCGLGGGDWNVVQHIINTECPDRSLTLWKQS